MCIVAKFYRSIFSRLWWKMNLCSKFQFHDDDQLLNGSRLFVCGNHEWWLMTNRLNKYPHPIHSWIFLAWVPWTQNRGNRTTYIHFAWDSWQSIAWITVCWRISTINNLIWPDFFPRDLIIIMYYQKPLHPFKENGRKSKIARV